MTITLEAIEAKQSELSKLIEQFRATTKTTPIEVPGAIIQLRPGERYAGLVLGDDGEPMCHLVLLPGYAEDVSWDAAGEWAKAQGGELPSRREQSLLFAHCKAHLQPRWHWSREAHEDDASYAWYCYFDDGDQGNGRKSFQGCAVAVRRLSA